MHRAESCKVWPWRRDITARGCLYEGVAALPTPPTPFPPLPRISHLVWPLMISSAMLRSRLKMTAVELISNTPPMLLVRVMLWP